MAGTFRVDSAFTIKGHGLFIRGRMVTGTVQAGATLSIPDGCGQIRVERITRVERGHASDAAEDVRGLVALQLGALDAADIPRVRALLAAGMELAVTDPEPE